VWVTCYTDASFSPRQGGAWAAWLRCERGRVVRSGRCPDYVSEATGAELAAIFAGVHLSLATWGAHVRGISVRSDSKAAIQMASPNARLARREDYLRLQIKLRELIAAHDLELDGRWVRGHQPLEHGTLAYLNDQCDKLAKRARRA
jgi:ribonuclease HI